MSYYFISVIMVNKTYFMFRTKYYQWKKEIILFFSFNALN